MSAVEYNTVPAEHQPLVEAPKKKTGRVVAAVAASLILATAVAGAAPSVFRAASNMTAKCLLDAYGRCVPEDCESYFDGCNTCSVPKDPYFGGRLGCTYLYCETPKEPKCLEYETEKN